MVPNLLHFCCCYALEAFPKMAKCADEVDFNHDDDDDDDVDNGGQCNRSGGGLCVPEILPQFRGFMLSQRPEA